MNAKQDRIYNDVRFLTSISPARNYQNLGSLEKAAGFIEAEFNKMGPIAEIQGWNVHGNEYKNVSVSYNPEKKQRLILGAHYDVFDDQPGADDNASAVAGLLEVARLVFENCPSIDYRIDFVAYCLEEPPFFGTEFMGSFVHARSLHEDHVAVLGMICLEMIGYYSDEPGSQPFPSPELAELYPDTANFIIVVGVEKYSAFNQKVHRLMAKDSGIDVQFINFPFEEGLAGLSDQRSYWKFDYPALMINDTSFIRNPNYHTKADTIETLDFEKMTAVINSIYRAVINMV